MKIKDVLGNRKIILGLMTLVLVFLIIIVSSFWPFVLDPNRIGNKEFWTDELIIMAITIASLVSTMFISQASNAQNPKSEIALAKVRFADSIKRIVRHSALFQWIKKVLQPRDRLDIAEKGMKKLGVDFAVYELNDSEIKSLLVAQKFGDKFFKALTQKQIDDVLELKKRVREIKFVSPSYYTTYNGMMSDKNLSEIASSENKKKISTVIFHLSLKMIISFTIAAIFTSLVIDLANDQSAAQAWMRFLSRLMSFVSSSFLGYLTGCKINDLDAFYITKRVEVHTLFLEDTCFKEVDEGKEEFKQRVLKEEHKLIGQDAHLIEMSKQDGLVKVEEEEHNE